MLTRFLMSAKNEKDVENHYRSELLNEFMKHKEIITSSIRMTSPFKCDGLLECTTVNNQTLKILLEFKKNLNLRDKLHQCNVIAQMLYYLKNFQESSEEPMPDCIFIGDIDECFILPTHQLIINYLGLDTDWNIAPSQVASKNPILINALLRDVSIAPLVFKVDDSFKLRKIIDIAIGISQKKYTEVHNQNLIQLFEFLFSQVILNKRLKLKTKIDLFLGILIDSEEIYLHPKKSNILVSDSHGSFEVNSNLCEFIMSNIFTEMDLSQIAAKLEKHYGKEYKPKKQSNENQLVDAGSNANLSEILTPCNTTKEMEDEFWKSFYQQKTQSGDLKSILEFFALRKSFDTVSMINFHDYDISLYHLYFSNNPLDTKQLLFKNGLTRILSGLRNSYTYDGLVKSRSQTFLVSKELIYIFSHQNLLDIYSQTDTSIANTNSYKAYLNRLCEGITIDNLCMVVPANTQTALSLFNNYLQYPVKSDTLDIEQLFLLYNAKNDKRIYDFFASFFATLFLNKEDAVFFVENRMLMPVILLDILCHGKNSQFLEISATQAYFLRNDQRYPLDVDKLKALLAVKKVAGTSSITDDTFYQLYDMAAEM